MSLRLESSTGSAAASRKRTTVVGHQRQSLLEAAQSLFSGSKGVNCTEIGRADAPPLDNPDRQGHLFKVPK